MISHDTDQTRTRELKHMRARIDELEAEVERLREALRRAKCFLYGSRAAFDQAEADRDYPHYWGRHPIKIVCSDDGTHPSACKYRVEVIETVAEAIEDTLDTAEDGGDE